MEKLGSEINLYYMISRANKIILYSILVVIPGSVVSYFFYCMLFGPSTKQVIIKKDLSENVNGVIDTLFYDDRNHNIRTALLKNQSIFEIPREWESDISAGDSLYKTKGSFILEVYKKKGGKIILDYRSTIK